MILLLDSFYIFYFLFFKNMLITHITFRKTQATINFYRQIYVIDIYRYFSGSLKAI